MSSNAQTFEEVLTGLEGVGKGQTAQGLHKVRQYLYRYGYLNEKDITSLNDSNKDYFDDVLESALKHYQKNFRLNISGKLHSDTIKLMAKPRCGVPDVMESDAGKCYLSGKFVSLPMP